jgi:hypothetical protein
MRRIALLAGIAALALLGVAQGDVVSGGNVRVSFRGWINPEILPRTEAAPIALHIAGTVSPIGDRRPAALESVTVEINRHGVINTRGLPICPWRRLRSTTSVQALAICRDALVGSGRFTSHIDIPEQAPFPAAGRTLAFNTVLGGRPSLVAHVFGKSPVPTSQVLPMAFRRSAGGQFGARLEVAMPKIGPDWGYVTGFSLTLERRYRHRGRALSLLSASCPAPRGIRRASFKAARGTYHLAGGRTLTRVLSGTCEVGEPGGGRG